MGVGGVNPEISSHCSPLLHDYCSQRGNSSKIFPLQPIASHSYKAISVRGLIPQKCSYCGPTLTSVYSPWQPNSYIILPPQSYTVLAPITEDCQSWTHNLYTLSCVALTSRPSMLLQLLTVYIYEEYLLELPPLSKLPPHSYIVLAPLDELPAHPYTVLTPLGSPHLHDNFSSGK